MRYHLTTVRMAVIKKTRSSWFGKDVEKRASLCTIGRDENWCSLYGSELPQSLSRRLAGVWIRSLGWEDILE